MKQNLENIIEKALLTIPKNFRKFTTQAFGGQSVRQWWVLWSFYEHSLQNIEW